MHARSIVVGAGLAGLATVLGRAAAGELRADKRRPSSARFYVFEAAQPVDAPLADVAPFFEDPANLGQLTPPAMGFRIAAIRNLPMQRGTEIDYRIRLLGVPQNWSTEIVEYEPGRSFADLQTAGPYRYWLHRHEFEEVDGRTVIRDRIEFQMPFGILGRLAHAIIVRRQLQHIFRYREQAIQRLFPSGPQAGESSSRS